MTAAVLVCALTFGIDVATPLDVAAGVPYMFAVLACLALRGPRVAFWVGALGVALTWAGWALAPAAAAPNATLYALSDRIFATIAILATTGVVALVQRREAAVVSALTGRLESLAALAGGVAHDFSNLVTVVSWEVSNTLENQRDLTPAHREGLRAAEALCGEAAKLVDLLYQYSGERDVGRTRLDLAGFVEDSRCVLVHLVEPSGTLDLQIEAPAVHIECNSTWLHQILINLLSNSAAALRPGGKVTVCVGWRSPDAAYLDACVLVPQEPDASRYALLEVSDDGAGIAPEDLPRIFEPSFTTREGGKGTGLASVYGLVRSLGGGIHVHSAVGRGTTFQVLFPPTEDRARAEREAPER